MKEWYTASELADLALPGLPETESGIVRFAKKTNWRKRVSVAGPALARRRQGRGGGWEYHYTVLPQTAQLRLVADSRKVRAPEAASRKEAGTGEIWAWFERRPDSVKRKAEARLSALDSVLTLERGGLQKNSAVHAIARDVGASARTIWNWFDLVAGIDRKDWLPYLAPGHRGRQSGAEMSPEAWDAFKVDWLRLEKPPAEEVYRRVQDVAEVRGWTLPSLKTVMRRVDREIPHGIKVLMRDGQEAVKRLYPAQERDRSHYHALEAVNADGHKMDTEITWPDGDEGRPFITAIQDLYSGKILAWRVDKAPNATGVRLAFYDVFKAYGIPDFAFLDNGREFASKLITGGQKTRFRFSVQADEMEGVLTALGVEVHWTTPYSGQSKPIERAFRDFCDHIAKHPALAGAYTGNSPTNKPDYKRKPVTFDRFLEVMERGVIRHNQRTGRRSRVCQGRLSFDQAFERSYEADATPIKRAGPEQLRMAMLAAEQKTARKPNGSIEIFKNRYWSEFLTDQIGKKLTVRFDPDALHDGIHVYRADGAYLGHAECWEAVGFDSVDAARDQGRKRRAFIKHTKAAAELETEISIEEWVAMQPDVEETPAPETRTVRMVSGANALKATPRAATQTDEEFDQERYGAMSNVLQLVADRDQ